ncbi:MAG TPA: potassium channel family protein [Burkholderiales bacterium]
MTSFLMTLLRFFRAFWRGLKDEEFRALLYVFLGLLVSGTAFYSQIEGWSLVDALYFSVITLATVGYGDLHPTTTLSKLFTILYILIGAGIFVAFITKVTLYETRKRRSHVRKAEDA